MRRSRWFSFSLILILAAVAFSPASISASPSMPYAGPPAAHYAPQLSATAAITIDLTSGLQLYSHNADMPVPPASTMKMVTVLVASQILGLDEMITIVESDLYLGEDYSQMGLMAGDVATVEILFYGAMLSSGADAALALARVAGQRLDPSTNDPIGRFVQEMNAFAQQHRMYGTNFTNPVGVDEEMHYSTARDLVRATEQMMSDWHLARVFSTAEVHVTVGGPNAREMYLFSTNQMHQAGDSVGGKTGTTEGAGQCLVNVIRRGDHTIVTVVLGSEDRYVDTQDLINDTGNRFRFVVLGAGSSSLGAADELAARGLQFPIRRTVLMTPEQAESLDYRLELSGNRSANDKAGMVVFTLGEHEISRLPVYGMN